MPESQSVKEKPSVEEVRLFVQENRVQANDMERRCVDGGYRPDQSEGSIALPGADLELCEILLTLKTADGADLFSEEQAFDMVYQFTQTQGGFFWHTDTHAQDRTEIAVSDHSPLHSEETPHQNAPLCGCGHFNAGMAHGEKVYGVSAERLQKLHAIMLQKQREHSNDGSMQCVILDREHDERAILLVTGTSHTVRPWMLDEVTGESQQYFVYDQTRTQQYLAKFAKYLQEHGHPAVSYQLLQAVFDGGLFGTLGLLASSRGKAIFEVNVDDSDNITVAESSLKAPDSPPQFAVDTRVERG